MAQLHRFLDEARGLLPAAVALRRRIHAKPELGLDLPLTTEAVLDGLQGLDVEIARGPSTSGLIVSLSGTKPGSQSGRTILLRGDMDALPMPEETGLDFASEIPGRMHACGHDSHTAMLVQAVHLLHRHRDELPGTVKFMFQPGEEGHAGARGAAGTPRCRIWRSTRCRSPAKSGSPWMRWSLAEAMSSIRSF